MLVFGNFEEGELTRSGDDEQVVAIAEQYGADGCLHFEHFMQLEDLVVPQTEQTLFGVDCYQDCSAAAYCETCDLAVAELDGLALLLGLGSFRPGYQLPICPQREQQSISLVIL